jgi:hypothetical protein
MGMIEYFFPGRSLIKLEFLIRMKWANPIMKITAPRTSRRLVPPALQDLFVACHRRFHKHSVSNVVSKGESVSLCCSRYLFSSTIPCLLVADVSRVLTLTF